VPVHRDLQRFEWRAILHLRHQGQRHSGEISLNGAAARKAAIGDILIICAYSSYSEAELATHEPVVVLIDEHNRAREVIRAVPALAKAS
jgi:aspartate 1-decarboxylase